MKNDNLPPTWVKDLGLFSGIITELLGLTGVGFLLGYGAWKKLGWPSWFCAVTSLLGMAAAFYRISLLSRGGRAGKATLTRPARTEEKESGMKGHDGKGI